LGYPNEYEVPAIPAGKSLAFSRTMSIWILTALFVIVALCALLLGVIHLKKSYPIFISFDSITNEWYVASYPDKDSKTLEQFQVVQEKLVHDFIINWFTITNDPANNEMRWQECDVSYCAQDIEQIQPNILYKECATFCVSSTSLFEQFTENIVPDYTARMNAEETWMVDTKTSLLDISPIGKVSAQGSSWQVSATIHSNRQGSFNILAFINIAKDSDRFPATLGYYVDDFNSYRIPK